VVLQRSVALIKILNNNRALELSNRKKQLEVIYRKLESTDKYNVIFFGGQFCNVPIGLFSKIISLLLTEREGRTGEHWHEVVAIRTERSDVRTKTTEGQYSPVRLELARLVSNLVSSTGLIM